MDGFKRIGPAQGIQGLLLFVIRINTGAFMVYAECGTKDI